MSDDKELEDIKKKKVKEIMTKKEGANFPDEPVKLNDSNFQEKLNEYPLVLVDFWADWCGPCKMVEPIIEELAEDLQGKAVFGKVNVDKNKQTASQFQVSSIPTMIVFKDGEVVDRMIGALPKEQIKQKLEPHMD